MTHRGGRRKGPRGATNPYRPGSPRAIAWDEGRAAAVVPDPADLTGRYLWVRPGWTVLNPSVSRVPATGDVIDRFVLSRGGRIEVEIACWIFPDGLTTFFRMRATKFLIRGEARDRNGVNTFLLSIERTQDGTD